MSSTEQIEQDVDPESGDDEGHRTSGGSNSSSHRSKCSRFMMRCIFSTPGLVALVIVYSLGGALIFPLLEAKHGGSGDHRNHHPGGGGGASSLTMSITKSREDCLRELWTITGE